jgi:stage II sporulation protein D
MRRPVLLLSLALGALALVAASAAPAASVFVIKGRGWGHGVGLSQCGAYGFARDEGWTYDRILAHYYPGTSLGEAPVAKVRVLLAEKTRSVGVSSEAPFTATDATGRSVRVADGNVTLRPELRLGDETLTAPVRFRPGDAPLAFAGRPYRGEIVAHAAGASLSVVNVVGLEEYLAGVVPGEMPSDWAPEALKAQAVAARSYALANWRKGGTYDVYSDTRSQVYGGIGSEDERTTAAVNATAGRVLLAPDGAVARTFFFASSGGRTTAAADVWGEEIEYLVPVDDPHDSICSTLHRWGPVVMTGRELRRKLGGQAPHGLRDVVVDRDATRRARTITFRGAGSELSLGGTAVRRLLGLRSTWIKVGVLSLDPGVGDDGKPALAGIVRGLGRVSVERESGSGVWERLARVRPAADGSFLIPVDAAGRYRLANTIATSAPVRIRLP